MKPTVEEFANVCGNYLSRPLIHHCYQSILHNDVAHNVEHVLAVLTYGKELVESGDYSHSQKKCVLAGCLIHDMGCRYDRASHHEIAYGMAFQLLQQFDNTFTPLETMLVAKACLEHRASWNKGHSNVVSELVAIADRGRMDISEMIIRCAQVRIANGVTSPVEVTNAVIQHLEEKVSGLGYMWVSYPDLGYVINGEKIDSIIDQVNDTDKLREQVAFVVNNLFQVKLTDTAGVKPNTPILFIDNLEELTLGTHVVGVTPEGALARTEAKIVALSIVEHYVKVELSDGNFILGTKK